MKDLTNIARIKGMASKRYSATEIGKELKISRQKVLEIAKDNKIDIEHGSALKHQGINQKHYENLKKQQASDP